ncbi:hypothetical protein JZ751_006830 [Albula glossodonta]|uniref:Uncharacterized protein n=1 Tax=Albula glossodonta TaxID=121402 RepID=A0A8T2P2H9_9TELE|nr:hypothetical protein JZ751_006830 [Albula glossodonta]
MAWWGGGLPGGMEDVRTPTKQRGYVGLQHRSRALQLQSQWQEITERERRAWVRNRQLLQDFQRAQDTLRDLAARSTAMATIRVEYERQLEQRFPQWQQRLEDRRNAAQHKEVELHLKKMEEEREGEMYSRTTKEAHIPPGPSFLPTPPVLPHSLTPSVLGDTHFHLAKSTKVEEENYIQNYPHIPWSSSSNPSCFIGAKSKLDVQQASSIKDHHSASDLRGYQDFGAAGYPFLHPLHPTVNQPFDPHWLLPQGQLHRAPTIGYPPTWPNVYSGFPPNLQLPYSHAPWLRFPTVDPREWGSMLASAPDTRGDLPTRRGGREGPESPKDSSQGLQGHKRQQRASDQSYELDIKPVRLSSARGDSSESSSICSEEPRGGTPETRKKRKESKGGMQQNGMGREQTTSQRSSVSSLTSNSVGGTTDIGAAPEDGIQGSDATPSTGEEDSHSQERASGVGAEAEQGGAQGTEEGNETQDSSQSEGGITGTEEDGRDEESGDKKEEGEEEVEKITEEEEEGEGEEGDVREESDVEKDVQGGEEKSGDEEAFERAVSSFSEEAEGKGVVLEQAEHNEDEEEIEDLEKSVEAPAKEVGEEVLGSERHGYSEEDEGTEGELEDREEQNGMSQERGEVEGEGYGSLEEGEMEEEEEEGGESERSSDAVEGDDAGEEGTGEAKEKAAAENHKEDSTGTTDSEDEIIISQLDKRTEDGEEEEAPPPNPTLDEEPKDKDICPQREKEQEVTVKSKALWQGSVSDSEDEVQGGTNLTMPLKDDLDDFDDFYD